MKYVYYLESVYYSSIKDIYLYTFETHDLDKNSLKKSIETEILKGKYGDALTTDHGSNAWSKITKKLQPAYILFEDDNHLLINLVGIGELGEYYDVVEQKKINVNHETNIIIRLYLKLDILEIILNESESNKKQELTYALEFIRELTNLKINAFKELKLRESNLREFYNKANRRSLFEKEGPYALVAFKAVEAQKDAKDDNANDPNMVTRPFSKINGTLQIKAKGKQIDSGILLSVNKNKIRKTAYCTPNEQLIITPAILKMIKVIP